MISEIGLYRRQVWIEIVIFFLFNTRFSRLNENKISLWT